MKNVTHALQKETICQHHLKEMMEEYQDMVDQLEGMMVEALTSAELTAYMEDLLISHDMQLTLLSMKLKQKCKEITK